MPPKSKYQKLAVHPEFYKPEQSVRSTHFRRFEEVMDSLRDDMETLVDGEDDEEYCACRMPVTNPKFLCPWHARQWRRYKAETPRQRRKDFQSWLEEL